MNKMALSYLRANPREKQSPQLLQALLVPHFPWKVSNPHPRFTFSLGTEGQEGDTLMGDSSTQLLPTTFSSGKVMEHWNLLALVGRARGLCPTPAALTLNCHSRIRKQAFLWDQRKRRRENTFLITPLLWPKALEEFSLDEEQ